MNGLMLPLIAASVTLTLSSTAHAADFELAAKFTQLPQGLTLTSKGEVKTDAKTWSKEKDQEGTELFTAKGSSEAKAAAMRRSDGGLEILISYSLKAQGEDMTAKPESSAGVFFTPEGKLAAVTTCEDNGKKDSVGRVCVTATPNLCQSLTKGEALTPDMLKEMEKIEMKALASILTLRGSDHQLENMVRAGNRLGLKTGLQTTRGQLMALAKQVAKELEAAKKDDAKAKPATAKADERAPSAQDAKATTDKASADKVAQESLMAKAVLEESLPRLKQACADSKF